MEVYEQVLHKHAEQEKGHSAHQGVNVHKFMLIKI